MPPRTSRGTTRKASASKIAAKPATIVFADAPEISTPPEQEMSSPELTLPETPSPFAAEEPPAPNALLNLRKIVMSHETVISILCIVVVSFILGTVLIGYIHTVQIDGLTMDTSASRESQLNVERNLVNLQNQIEEVDQRVATLESLATSEAAAVSQSVSVVATGTTPISSLPVAHPAASAVSPSGALVRGSFSPDGLRYAGYDTKTVGKKGVAVETVSSSAVKLVVPFNPAVQSSGLGLPQESSMTVRWLDAKTLQYDVIIKNSDGTKTQKVETIKINF